MPSSADLFLQGRAPSDNNINPDARGVCPAFGELIVNDGTGLALTTPTSATVLAGSPMVVGQSNVTTLANAVNVSATTGLFTAPRSGIYLCGFMLAEITPVNSQVITLEMFKNGATLGSTTAMISKFTQPGTAVAVPAMSQMGFISLTAGDTSGVYAIASTGNFTVKRMRAFWLQVVDAALPTRV